MKIEVNVRPNSGEQKIQKISNKKYKVNLKSQAEKNKANIELIKLLRKHFQRNIIIKGGKTSSKKLVIVE